MRSTCLLLKNARAPQIESEVPLKIMRPLKLRDYVSGRSDASSQVICLQEMAILLACMKASEYSELPCQKEITAFKQCVDTESQQIRYREEMAKKGVFISTNRKMDHRQLNLILEKYSDPKRK